MTATTSESLQNLADQMKRDWDERARVDAKWFINCVKPEQDEEEFDATGLTEVQRLITNDLRLLIGNRDPRSLRLLEIGCGVGRMTKYLAAIFGEVYGTDVSAEMIHRAQARLRSYPNIYLYETNGCDFAEFQDEYFDLIFSAYVFQHVPDKEVILSNIRDAYRLLKPGCRFKFVSSSVTNKEFLQMPKDTWSGAPLFEEEIRDIAREMGAQLVGITDVGTQYCWTILRKPQSRVLLEPSGDKWRPTIIDIGRADDLAIKEIPARGDRAYARLIVQGLDLDEVDANSVVVELRGARILPCYVGPLEDGSTEQLQINFRIPEDDPGGNANVRVQLLNGSTSNVVTAHILPPQPVAPQIKYLNNCADGGLDIYATGPKSKIKLFTEGLDDNANVESIRVCVDKHQFRPEAVSFIPGNGVWLIVAQLPEDTAPGDTAIGIIFRDLVSPTIPLHLK